MKNLLLFPLLFLSFFGYSQETETEELEMAEPQEINVFFDSGTKKYGLTDKDGNSILPAIYDEILYNETDQSYLHGNGFFRVRIGEDFHIVNANGKGDLPAEMTPEFPGGIAKFYEFLGKKYKVPKKLKHALNGVMYVAFIVRQDGSLTDIEVLNDLGYGTAEEAVKVLKKSPKWKPGTLNGKPISVKYTLPIRLNLKP